MHLKDYHRKKIFTTDRLHSYWPYVELEATRISSDPLILLDNLFKELSTEVKTNPRSLIFKVGNWLQEREQKQTLL